jgi:hypothetical protein
VALSDFFITVLKCSNRDVCTHVEERLFQGTRYEKEKMGFSPVVALPDFACPKRSARTLAAALPKVMSGSRPKSQNTLLTRPARVEELYRTFIRPGQVPKLLVS